MKINISNIRVKERIRKEINKIEELAADIRQNGLISPIAVMPFTSENNGEKYQLLAGLRRIRAVQSLGWSELEAYIITPKDAEEALRIEISENEQREQFTPSEKLDYGRQLERIETVKALERKAIGGQGGFREDTDLGPYLERGERRNIIGSQLGMSGKQYERLKYIGDNATAEVIEELDRGERTIRGTYDCQCRFNFVRKCRTKIVGKCQQGMNSIGYQVTGSNRVFTTCCFCFICSLRSLSL